MLERRLKSFNWTILGSLGLLLLLSLIMVYSATNGVEFSSIYRNYYLKQIIWILLGFTVLFAVSRINYGFWVEISYPLYYITLFLLVLLALIDKIGGFQNMRWFRIGPFTFQPSEFAKLSIPLVLTKFLVDYKGKINLVEGFFRIGVLVGIPMALILIQPDLGTAMIFVPLVFIMLFMSGVKPKYLVYTISAGIMASPFFWFLMKDYQKKRLLSFMNPEADWLGSGYSVIQSKIAIGSGGFFGKGLLKGTQSQLNFIPEHHTDFIFSVIGEELGFVGAFVVLFLYYLMIMEGVKIAMHSKDKTGMLLAVSIIAVMMTQIFYNLGMTLGLLPVVGVPLPFLSYGGSSMLFSMALIGILLNIHTSIKRFSV